MKQNVSLFIYEAREIATNS